MEIRQSQQTHGAQETNTSPQIYIISTKCFLHKNQQLGNHLRTTVALDIQLHIYPPRSMFGHSLQGSLIKITCGNLNSTCILKVQNNVSSITPTSKLNILKGSDRENKNIRNNSNLFSKSPAVHLTNVCQKQLHFYQY